MNAMLTKNSMNARLVRCSPVMEASAIDMPVDGNGQPSEPYGHGETLWPSLPRGYQSVYQLPARKRVECPEVDTSNKRSAGAGIDIGPVYLCMAASSTMRCSTGYSRGSSSSLRHSAPAPLTGMEA